MSIRGSSRKVVNVFSIIVIEVETMTRKASIIDIEGRLNRLIRQPQEDISAYLSSIEINIPIQNTKAVAHCHMVSFDGNCRPRVAELATYLGNIIIDYAIPRSQIKEAQEKDILDNTTRNVSALKKKAKALFTELKNTGEGGEMLLYLLAQHVLKMPQILCKMSLKTSGNVHFHGVDGLHIKYDNSINKLALYWGESKMYKDIGSAISDCLDSIKPFLIDDTKKSNLRDLQLFQDNLDLVDNELEDQLINYLDPDHANFNKMQFRGVCLVGFDEGRYPTIPNQKTHEILSLELKSSIQGWKDKLQKRLLKRKPLDTFILEIFLIPLPSVQLFRDAFLEEVKNA